MAEILNLTADDSVHGKRLDAALSTLVPDYSRSVLRQFIEEGRVQVDGVTAAKPSQKLSAGQVITLDPPEPELLEAKPQDLPLEIVYQDDDLIVINKPIGFVVHPGSGIKDGTVMNAMLFHFPQTAALPRAGIVHRLDKDTSGLMVIALTAKAQQVLSKAISKHEVVREYEAIAEGVLTAGGTIEGDIGRDPYNRTRMAVVPDGMGREAVTHYRVMERYRAHTRIRLRLETGRTHQIRVHMASIEHPLLGDVQYGGRRLKHLPRSSQELDEALKAYRHQALHAVHLQFLHPITGENLSFDCPLPQDMLHLIELLRQDAVENAGI